MNIIETHDLCKQYGNALRVAHLNLDVPEGSVYGFLGPNGAGKSTTLKMILGLVHPTAGSIRVLGKGMDNKNRLSVLPQVGNLIESPSYYSHLTGEENLRIVQTLRGVPEKDIREALKIVRLDGQRGKKVAHYSLGMKQRLGLAAASSHPAGGEAKESEEHLPGADGKDGRPVKLLKPEFYKCRRRKIVLVCAAVLAVGLVWMGAFFTRQDAVNVRWGWMLLLYNLAMVDAIILSLSVATLASRSCELEHKGNT